MDPALLLDMVLKKVDDVGVKGQIRYLYRLTYETAYKRAIEDQKEKCGCNEKEDDDAEDFGA